MTVQELIELLETMDPEAEVWLDGGDINYISAESVRNYERTNAVIIS